MSNYPDNMPAPRHGWATFHCTNEDCKTKTFDVVGVFDFGTFSAYESNDTLCPNCGQEGE